MKVVRLESEPMSIWDGSTIGRALSNCDLVPSPHCLSQVMDGGHLIFTPVDRAAMNMGIGIASVLIPFHFSDLG